MKYPIPILRDLKRASENDNFGEYMYTEIELFKLAFPGKN